MKLEHIIYAASAHSETPTKPSKAFRKWDGKTPYYVHPIWCATTLATESTIDEHTRQVGMQALLYHDILEDTTVGLPHGLEPEVRELVDHMTFESNKEEKENIWQKPPLVRLLKLYDKTSNMLDSSWMDAEKKKGYSEYLGRLAQDVEANYGILNIIRLARSLL